MLNNHMMETLIWIAGLGQIVLSLGSLFVPKVLNWKTELQKALAMFAERKIQFTSNTWKHIWVLFWLLAPLPLLFHKNFLSGIIWPVVGFHT